MNDLQQYGIHFRVDDAFVKDFFAIKEGYAQQLSCLDCLKDELIRNLHALYSAGWISLEDVCFVESNFIYSDKGYLLH